VAHGNRAQPRESLVTEDVTLAAQHAGRGRSRQPAHGAVHIAQAELAQRMGIAACSLARIEASVGSRKHAPSLATLRKYAAACGRHLSLGLT